MRRPVKRSGGAAGLFVLLGILTILAVTFAAGTYAGRIWATRPRVVAAVSPAEREPARRGADTRASRLVEPAPRLTFYQELTAPLTAPPPPPKPAKTSPPPLVTNGASPSKASMPDRASKTMPETTVAIPETLVGRDAATTASNRPPTNQAGLAAPATTITTATTSPAPTITTAATPARFTIQVGAYRLRPPADALRATLVAAGHHDARVVENDAANGVRFRVQIGDFASRDAARDAAARFTGPTFVTTR
jgi:cell division protein FtsN